jgi:hypothetical protein
MITHVTNAAQSAWKTAKRAYHLSAFLSLGLVLFAGWQIAHGHLLKFDGVAHAELPFRNPQQAMVAQLPADQVLPPQATQAIPDAKATKAKLVAEGPRPGEKPPVPPTPGQVR